MAAYAVELALFLCAALAFLAALLLLARYCDREWREIDQELREERRRRERLGLEAQDVARRAR